ncbi:MAG: hypothetical protein Q9M36_00165 [Sulfurovum sp.]|nr:hypothetical protein [Sulfurovum sp.]
MIEEIRRKIEEEISAVSSNMVRDWEIYIKTSSGGTLVSSKSMKYYLNAEIALGK